VNVVATERILAPNILRTWHQIHDEATGILYGSRCHTPEIYGGKIMFLGSPFKYGRLSSAAVQRLSHIRELDITIDSMAWVFISACFAQIVLLNFFGQLPPEHKLQKIKIRLYDELADENESFPIESLVSIVHAIAIHYPWHF
jgi:hypothetical protein